MKDEKDPLVRGPVAVALTVLPVGNGKFRLFVDDLRRETDGPDRRWHHDTFVTHVTIDEAKLRDLTFERDELEDLGFLVLSCLKVRTFRHGSRFA